jgi:hypothetical protein
LQVFEVAADSFRERGETIRFGVKRQAEKRQVQLVQLASEMLDLSLFWDRLPICFDIHLSMCNSGRQERLREERVVSGQWLVGRFWAA